MEIVMETLPRDIKYVIDEYLADGFFDEGDEKIFLNKSMLLKYLDEQAPSQNNVLELADKCILYEKPTYIACLISYLPQITNFESLSMWDACCLNQVLWKLFRSGCLEVLRYPELTSRNRFDEELESAVGSFVQLSKPNDNVLKNLYVFIQPFYNVNYLNVTGEYLGSALCEASDLFLEWLLETYKNRFNISELPENERQSAGICLLDSLICRKRFLNTPIRRWISKFEELGILF
jgi:hypothetical protein